MGCVRGSSNPIDTVSKELRVKRMVCAALHLLVDEVLPDPDNGHEMTVEEFAAEVLEVRAAEMLESRLDYTLSDDIVQTFCEHCEADCRRRIV